MSILNINSKHNFTLHDLYAICNYITNSGSTRQDLIYGNNISVFFPSENMELIKQVFHQNYGKTYFHIVLSLDTHDFISLLEYKSLSVEVCDLLANFHGSFQVLMAVHINTENLHTHFISNNIDYLLGKRFHFNLAKLYEVKHKINLILEKYNVSAIKTYIP